MYCKFLDGMYIKKSFFLRDVKVVYQKKKVLEYVEEVHYLCQLFYIGE